MAAHATDRKRTASHQPDIDAAIIVAVDQHDVIERRAADGADQGAIEPGKGRPAFRFDDTQNVSPKLIDHACRVAHRLLVDRLDAQFQRADPVGTAVRDDL